MFAPSSPSNCALCLDFSSSQECKSPETARKVLDEKGVAHLWDMVVASAKAARASAASAMGGAAGALGGY